MATIPLPALHTAPIEQPTSPLAMYGQMMGIQSAQQEMAQRQTMAPLQQEQAQTQVQAGQLELQQQQQAQKDQQSFRTAMQAPENQGKTIGDIADTLSKSGSISMQGWQQMKKADIDQRTALATLDEKGLANAAAAHKQTQDLYNNAMDMPDEELAANWPAIAQQYDAIPGNQKMPLNPQQPLTKAQLQQFGPMLSMHGAYLDEAMQRKQKAADLTKAQGATDPQSPFYAPSPDAVAMGTAPGSAQIEAGEAQQAAAVAKAKLPYTPAVVVQNMNNASASGGAGAPQNQLPGGGTDWGKLAQTKYGMSPAAFDQQAEQAGLGKFPPIGRNANAIALNRDLMSRYAELHPDASIAQNSAEFKANSESLKKLQTNFDQVQAFEGTASKNFDLLQQTAQSIPDLGTKFANVPVRMLSADMIGTVNMAKFKTALNTAQTEAAKVLNSSNATGVLSDSARHELQQIIDPNATLPAITGSLNTLKQEFGNRTQTYQDQIGLIQQRLKSATAPSAGGGQQAIAVTAPNGKVYSFKDQQSADTFKRSAGMQ
jgi:hypothetical protein